MAINKNEAEDKKLQALTGTAKAHLHANSDPKDGAFETKGPYSSENRNALSPSQQSKLTSETN